MKPICVKCHRFFKPIKSGFYFIEGMPKENGAKPELKESNKWQPYKIWSGDKWECKDCGSIIINGTGYSEVAEHYQDDFQSKVQQLQADQF